MANETLRVGDLTITRIQEWQGTFIPPADLLVGFQASVWEQNLSWLVPDHYDPPSGTIRGSFQPFVIRGGGRTILFDTGAGNDKSRPNIPIFGGWKTDFLERLAAAGVAPKDVDLVICSHLHIDHVGWNTRLDGAEWVPTFPNARYLFPKPDVVFWDPANDSRFPRRVGQLVNAGVFDDSVRPVIEAGLATAVEGDHVIDERLRLEPHPGHTPGQMVLKIDSKGEKAVLCGDVMHSPMQILRPDWNSCFCESAEGARASRRRVLEWCADQHAILLPAHYCGRHAVWVKRAGDGFAIDRWAAFGES